MGTITSPSGLQYNWANKNPPTESDFKSIAAYETAQGISAQSPATTGDMRRRENQPAFGQPILQSQEPDQGPAQVGQPFPLVLNLQ